MRGLSITNYGIVLQTPVHINRCDMRCDKLCDRGNPCRKLSQRLIAKVEPGSTFATAIVRRVRQRPIFMTPSFVSLGTRGNFTRESGEGRKLRMVICPSETFPFHFVFGHCAFPSADTLQWILRTFPARHSLPLRRTILVRS